MDSSIDEIQINDAVKRIARIIALVIVIVGACAVVVYSQCDKLQPSPALKLTITTNLNNTNDLPEVVNVTFEQATVPFFYRKADTPPKFPDVSVETKLGTLMSAPAGYRVGIFRPVEGTYELTIVFREGMEPKPNDLLIMAVRLTDFRGAVIKKTTVFYEWK